MPPRSLPADLRALVEDEDAFAAAEAALSRGRRVVLGGLPGGARAVLLAALARRRPLLIIAPTEDDLPALEDDLRALVEEDARPILRNPSLELPDDGDADDEEESPVARDDGEDAHESRGARGRRGARARAGDEERGDGDEGELADSAELDLVLAAGSGVGGRLRVLQALAEDPAPVVLSSVSALLERVPDPQAAMASLITIRPGETLDPHQLAVQLARTGHVRVPLVEAPGELAIRGGIVDIYPLGAASPVRLELVGDEVESIRRFEPGSQRSTATVDRLVLPLLSAQDYLRLRRTSPASLLAHLPREAAVVLLDPARARARLGQGVVRLTKRALDLIAAADLEASIGARPLVLVGDGASEDDLASTALDLELPFEPAEVTGTAQRVHDPAAVGNELARLVGRGERLTVACLTEAEREHLATLLGEAGLKPDSAQALRTKADPPGITLVTWPLDAGFRVASRGVWLVAAHRLFRRHRRGEANARKTRARGGAGATIESFADLEPGQAVVHVSHGIALFRGIVRRDRDGQPRDYLELEFDGQTLAVPTDRIGLVRRYIGPGGAAPRLSKIGGQGWKSKTKKAAEAVKDLAAELLEVQAERQMGGGTAFPPDDRAQVLFEESFGYTDTEDQARVTVEVKRDMEQSRPMDRLVCGDVGYGKTEIAVRAAFKCAMAGRQAAVLVPTTILAHQHQRVFAERMAAYPIRVEAVSRFRTQAEQRQILRDTAAGKVDILIGTHRLLSRDVAFRDLGLVVIDEEQRFGVEHKERLKALRRSVDLLTLSATPIPRTLHLALSGARDISLLQTPPPGRAPVETKVVRRSDGVLRRAIERELARDGQVFVVHDRVRTIDELAREVRELVPDARVLVVHGQLPEEDIEDRMMRFVEHEADVLVATTLIENGLDIRRANTLIVDRAHNYGLAELHQLRGRVGRSDVHAFAYFMLPEHGGVSDVSARRLRAIEEFTELGAGFQIAMRDLEIRGAGNVLGAEQSGHIADVGYDLYCRLLKRAMAELAGQAKGGKPLDLEKDLDLEAGEVELVLDVPAYVPDAYIDDVALKIECYRKLASAAEEGELTALEGELRDRYGAPPEALTTLFDLRRARIRAAAHGVIRVTRQDRVLQLRCRDPLRLGRGVRAHHDRLRPIDETMVYVVLPDENADDRALLVFLLELLRPVDEAPTEFPSVDAEAAKRERQRRMRARGHRRKRTGKA